MPSWILRPLAMAILALPLALPAWAQPAPDGGAGPAQTLRVIDRQAILDSGAQDLEELLSRIPGFQLAVDAAGVVGLLYRGIWAQEGRVALLVDGVPQNERLFGGLQLGHHYPLDQLQRIEIRETTDLTGSGGFAELASINLVTRPGADLRGSAGSTLFVEPPSALGARLANLAFGERWGPVDLSAQLFTGVADRSDQRYRDLLGNSVPLTYPNAEQRPLFVDVGARVHDLQLRLLFDDYQTLEADGVDAVHTPVSNDFRSWSASLEDRFSLGEAGSLTPSVLYQQQTPWRVLATDVPEHLDKSDERAQATLAAQLKLPASVQLASGAQATLDRVWLNSPQLIGVQTLERGQASLSEWDFAGWARGQRSQSWGTVRAGARVEIQQLAGWGLTGELGYRREWSAVAVDLKASSGARMPALEQLNDALLPLRAEQDNALEARLGWQPVAWAHSELTVFGHDLEGAIVYGRDPATGRPAYANRGQVRRAGFTASQALTQTRAGTLALAYTYVEPFGPGANDPYLADGQPLAVAGHQLSAQWSCPLGPHLTVSGAAVVLGSRVGKATADLAGPVAQSFAPEVLLGAFLHARKLTPLDLDLSLGVSNLLNQSNLLLQPYDGGHGPLPSQRRELILRLGYGG